MKNLKEEQCHILLVSAEEEAKEFKIDSLRGPLLCNLEVVGDIPLARDAVGQPGRHFQIIIIDTLTSTGSSEWPNPEALGLVQFIRNQSPASDIILLINKGQERAWRTTRTDAFSYVYKPFNWDNLHLLIRHSVEHGQLQTVNREKRILEDLLNSGSTLLVGQDQQTVFDSVLEGIVTTLYDRARLYLLSDDRRRLIGMAQKGMDGGFVKEWRVEDYPYFEKLLENPRPQVFNREDCEGPFRAWLEAEQVEEWGSVPLVVSNNVIGKISVDNKSSREPINEGDLQVVALFATQAAAAIENSRLLESTRRQRQDLEAVLHLTSTINSSLDLSETLQATCRSAVELLKVDHSGLVIFDSELKNGEVCAEFPTTGLEGRLIPISGIPAEEVLTKMGEHIRVNDVEAESARQTLGPVRDLLIQIGVKSTLILPVKRGARVLGSFSLETMGGKRSFTEEEVELCKNFAEQVGTAIENAQLFEETRGRARQLEKLRETTLAINAMSDPAQLLDEIIARGVELLDAQSGGLYRREMWEKTLTIIRDSSRPENVGKKLREGEGMAGYLVASRKPYSIVNDYSAWPERAPIFGEKTFGAVVEVPLKLKDEITGVLYIDSPVGREFREEEAQLLAMFAEYAAVVLDRAEQRNNLERLIDSSPHGIIAADNRGRIIEFNKRAEELTQRKKADVQEKDIGIVYHDQGEPRRIGALLHQSGGRIEGYETAVSSHNLDVIPILLSATWLYDINGEIMGSIGYFEDRRGAEEKDRYVRLLVEACTLMAEAERPINELQRFAELFVTNVSFRYCRILLFDGDPKSLIVNADFQARRENESPWPGEVGQVITDNDLPELHEPANRGLTVVLRAENEEDASILRGISSWMSKRLGQSISHLTVVPMKAGNSVKGILELGEVRDEYRNPITTEKLLLAEAVASLASALIERRRLTEQLQFELEQQNRATQSISNAFELQEVMWRIVSEARRLFNADSCALWPYEDYQLRFNPEQMTADGLSDQMVDRLRLEEASPGRTAQVILKKGYLDVPDVSDADLSMATQMVCAEEGIRSFHGVLLKAGDDPVGVLYLNYRRLGGLNRRKELLENLATVSGLSLKKARLLDQVSRAKTAAEGVAKMVTLGQRDETLKLITEEVLNIVGCDLVTLYEYDQSKELLIQPPTVAGVLLTTSSVVIRETGTDSLLFKLIEKKDVHPVPNTDQDPLFARSRFTQEEKIKSSIAIPLRLAGRKVGIIFINYRSPHRFSAAEIDTLTLFANQAAVALRNEQLYESSTRKGKNLAALQQASKKFSESFGLARQEIFNEIARQSYECLVSGRSEMPSFAAVQLYDPEHDTLTFESTYPHDALPRLASVVGKTRSIDPRSAPMGRRGLTGRAVRTREAVLVKDVTADGDHLPVIPGMRSELVVPLIDYEGDRVLGVINVQSDRPNDFDRDDQDTLLTLGGIAVTAIKNSDLFDELSRTNLELAEVNRRLREADRRRTEFFENVSHELGTPITGIINTLENMLDGELGELSPLQADRVRLALSSAYREEQIIKNLLNMREIDEDRETFTPAPESLASLIAEEVKTFYYQSQRNGQQITLYLSQDDPLTAEVDRDKFRSIIMNLVGNALKFTPSGGQVSVTAARGEGVVEVAVRDNGIGIPREQWGKIFERHYRVPAEQKRPGIGLGLHIVKTYVELHGGHVGVESEVGKGSTFNITLPFSQSRRDAEADAADKENPRH